MRTVNSFAAKNVLLVIKNVDEDKHVYILFWLQRIRGTKLTHVSGKDVMLWKKFDSFFNVFTISHNSNVASGQGDGE